MIPDEDDDTVSEDHDYGPDAYEGDLKALIDDRLVGTP